MTRRTGFSARLAAQLALYNLLLLAALPLLMLWLLWRRVARRKSVGDLRARFGFVPKLADGSPRIWLHAVSAGEMGAAAPVLRALRAAFPSGRIVVSTHTDTGMETARKQCKEADAIFYLPFDFFCSAALALRRVRPEALIVIEKELWPNLLGLARLRGTRVVTVNGRVSDRMVKRGRFAPSLVRWLYRMNDLVCMQSAQDAARLRELGLSQPGPAIIVAGNTKADLLGEPEAAAEARLREALEVQPDEYWLVAGSTHRGEEEQVVDAFLNLRQRLPGARLLLAPRHPERLPEVSAMLAQRSLRVVRRSEGRHDAQDAVVVLDTMGELRAAYALATVAFVGGTFAPIGGHNLLEPAANGVPVLFGPHTENCVDMAELLLVASAGERVASSGELAAAVLRLAQDPAERSSMGAAGRALVQQLRGASDRCVAAISTLLAEGGAR